VDNQDRPGSGVGLGASWRDGPAANRVAELCISCVGSSHVDGGGVSVVTSLGTGVAMYATDATSSAIQDLQLTLGEGPYVDASNSGTPVLVSDLADPAEGIGDRWPHFRDEASRLGVRAVFAFPIRIGAIGLGTLDLFRLSTGPLADRELSHALLAVDALGHALLDFDAYEFGNDLLSPQMVVHQAAGMVMVQLETTIEHAMLRLRATAYGEAVSINTLAADVVSGRRHFTEDQP
jgi:hypothetical protein